MTFDVVFRFTQYNEAHGYKYGTSVVVRELVLSRLPLKDWNALLELKSEVEKFVATQKKGNEKQSNIRI